MMARKIIIGRVVAVDLAENITANIVVKEGVITPNRVIIHLQDGEAVAAAINIISLQMMKATMRNRD